MRGKDRATAEMFEESFQSGAKFSDCGRYRYRLWRRWGSEPHVVMLAMNPSTADEIKNDPTIERFQRRAAKWRSTGKRHVGGIEVVNVFAWRETNSDKLAGLIAGGHDLVGPENDQAILDACKGSEMVIVGWGQPGLLMGRHLKVLELLASAGITPYAFAVNADGSPKHPLYVGYNVEPQPYAYVPPPPKPEKPAKKERASKGVRTKRGQEG